ncbi:MAG: aldo/keto reductase [Candidatus Bathyarchaeia archaeon]
MQHLRKAFAFYEKQRQADRIGLYGLATWSCFRTARGRSGHYLSLEDVVHLAGEVAGEDHGFRFIQLPFNLTMPEAFTLQNQPVEGKSYSILEAAEKLGVGVFTSVPLMQGALARNPSVPEIEGLKTPAQRSLQVIRSAPGAMIAPLVGHKTLSHVRENIEVASVPPLHREEFERIIAKVKFRQHD